MIDGFGSFGFEDEFKSRLAIKWGALKDGFMVFLDLEVKKKNNKKKTKKNIPTCLRHTKLESEVIIMI